MTSLFGTASVKPRIDINGNPKNSVPTMAPPLKELQKRVEKQCVLTFQITLLV